jgi:hypothetical protein
VAVGQVERPMHMGMGSGADGSTRWEAASGQAEEVERR